MRVLVAYGTTEGQTQKIAEAITLQVGGLGHEVELFNTTGLQGDLHPEMFDKIIVAASVHERRHQESVGVFVAANRETLKAKPTMFVSVSLAAAFERGMADAQGYADAFFDDLSWRPSQILLVAGAVRHGAYGYYKEHILEHVVLQGRELDDRESDHEFTDWTFLAGAIADFVAV